VIYVDDQAAREFSHHDAHLLGLLADQAAIAMVNATPSTF
jgi:GAF domain-containing protein